MTRAATSGSSGPAPIDCKTAVMRLWDYLDGRLPDMAREEVELHLATCALCPPHFVFASEMRRALASSAPQRLGAGEEAVLRARVHSALARLGDTEGE